MGSIGFETRIGRICISEENGCVTRVYLPGSRVPSDGCENSVLKTARDELLEYLDGKRKTFDFKMCQNGTAFQNEVWKALSRIPYGETRSYGEIAVEIGHPGAARAVGSACGANQLPILVPCHRVVPASGGIGYYAGGKDLKRILLDLEKSLRYGAYLFHYALAVFLSDPCTLPL